MIRVKLSKQIYLKISAKGYLTYSYSFGMPFELTLLSEVGGPVRPIYLEYFRQMGYEVETIKLSRSPWLQDVIKNFR